MTTLSGHEPVDAAPAAATPSSAAQTPSAPPSGQLAYSLPPSDSPHSGSFPSDSPPWGLTTKAIVASAVLLLAAIAVWRFRFLITPLVVAGVVAYLVNPFVRWLQRKTAIKRSVAVLIVYALTFLVFSALSIGVGLVVAEQSARLWSELPDLLPRLVDAVRSRLDVASHVVWTIGPYRVNFGEFVDLINWDALSEDLREPLQTVAGRSGRWLANFAQATVSTLGNALLVITISLYLAIDAPRIGQVISDMAHQTGYRDDADRLINDTIIVWNAYLRGQVMLGLVIGVVVAVVLAVLGVNYALALGLLSGVLEFLPVVGPLIGALAAILVALFQPDNPFALSPWVYALIVMAAMIIIQQIENNVLVPRIVGDALDLHPVVVIVAVLMGASLAGLLGAVLAAPVAASLKLYGVYVWRKMWDLPPFPDPEPLHPSKSQPSLFANLTSLLGMRPQQK